jgi:hypothetical protein
MPHALSEWVYPHAYLSANAHASDVLRTSTTAG